MKFRERRGLPCKPLLAAVLIVSVAACTGNPREVPDALARGGQSLVIRESGSRVIYGTWPLEERGAFAVEFIHSVNQSPVREYFRAEEGMIRPFSVRFFSFGAGMQSDLEEGQTLSREGDALLISGAFPARKELAYIVGTVSDHLLVINGETISLRELCGRNAHITITIRAE